MTTTLKIGRMQLGTIKRIVKTERTVELVNASCSKQSGTSTTSQERESTFSGRGMFGMAARWSSRPMSDQIVEHWQISLNSSPVLAGTRALDAAIGAFSTISSSLFFGCRVPEMLWRDRKLLQIYGANTNVGKTIVSTILCNAFQRRAPRGATLYLKPVSTGPLEEADDRYVSHLERDPRL
jgi:hypothetical protein